MKLKSSQGVALNKHENTPSQVSALSANPSTYNDKMFFDIQLFF